MRSATRAPNGASNVVSVISLDFSSPPPDYETAMALSTVAPPLAPSNV